VIPPFPTAAQLSQLLPDEIAEASDLYAYAIALYLQVDQDTFFTFSDVTSPPAKDMVRYLRGYVVQRILLDPSLAARHFDDRVFNVIYRFISEGTDISCWITWQFILGVVYSWYDSRQLEVSVLLGRLWRRAREKMTNEFSSLRDLYITSFQTILLDGSQHLIQTLTALRYMASMDSNIINILVDSDGEFLSILHHHYGVYKVHLSTEGHDAIIYFFYTVLMSLAFRASESSLVQNKKGKSVLGSSESLFFQLFDREFGEYIREGVYDEFIKGVTEGTPFVELITDWVNEWKGADEAIETLTQYLTRLKFDEEEDTEDVHHHCMQLTPGHGTKLSHITGYCR